MQRFFVSPELLTADKVELRDPQLLHQLTRVLRVAVGSQVVLLSGEGGTECVVTVTRVEKRGVFGEVAERRAAPAEPAIVVTLLQAVPRQPSKLEEILQHGTEVGVSRFVPLLTDRCGAREIRNTARLQKILREAAEQSERGAVPQLADPVKMLDLLKNVPSGVNLLADSFTAEPQLGQLLPAARAATHVNFWVGPEGGFTAREVAAATAAGVQNFSLGPRILRTETAGLACVSALFFG